MNLAFQLKIRLIKDVCSEIFLISMKSQKNMLLIEELKVKMGKIITEREYRGLD